MNRRKGALHRDNDVFGQPTSSRFHLHRDHGRSGGRAAASLVPLVAQMNRTPPLSLPAADRRRSGADRGGAGDQVFWRGKPIYVERRSKKEIDDARAVNIASLPTRRPTSGAVKEGTTSGSC